jgi:lipopolysaccharide heptosyltransferase I
MATPAGRDFSRILIIKPSSPGDIIHALPVLHGLRQRYPGAHIAWLVAESFAELLEKDPAIDEVIPFDRRRFGFLGRSLRVTGEFLSFLRSLRRRQFDLVIDLQGLFRSGFLAWAAGAPVRLGFARARELAWLFYTDRVDPGPTDEHAADRNYRVAAALGFAGLPMDFSLCVTAEDRAAARALLDEAGIAPGRPYVVLVPATRWETKCWPAERFGEVARDLQEIHGLPSVLVGGKDDLPAGGRAGSASSGAARNLCGRTSLRQLAAVVEGARLVVTADSTPMHIAAAFDRPLVALFGPTNPLRTGPYGRLDDVLRLDLPCSPCYFRRLSQCPHDHACMRDLPPRKVVDRVAEELKAAPGAGLTPSARPT